MPVRTTKRLTLGALALTAATVLVSIAPERVSAAVTDSVLYWRDATKTLYSSSVEILGSYQTSGYKFVTAKTQIINDSSGTRDAECTLSYGGSVDRSRVKLSSKRRATIFLEVMGSDNSGNAYLLCRVVSSSTSGVKTAWSKMNVMSINKGWAYQQ